MKINEKKEPGKSMVNSAVQAVLDPGDMILWDSRVVHCNQGPCPRFCRAPSDTAALRDGREREPLHRLVAYISMVPGSRLTPKLAAQRRACVMEGRSSGHDPTNIPSGGRRVSVMPGYRPPTGSDPKWALVAPGMGNQQLLRFN